MMAFGMKKRGAGGRGALSINDTSLLSMDVIVLLLLSQFCLSRLSMSSFKSSILITHKNQNSKSGVARVVQYEKSEEYLRV